MRVSLSRSVDWCSFTERYTDRRWDYWSDWARMKWGDNLNLTTTGTRTNYPSREAAEADACALMARVRGVERDYADHPFTPIPERVKLPLSESSFVSECDC